VQTFGAKPRPRILVWADNAADELIPFVESIAATVRVLISVEDIANVRQQEWDAVVVLGDPPPVGAFNSSLMAIQFGPGKRILQYSTSSARAVGVHLEGFSVATEFIIPDTTPAISRLVSRSLLPYVQSQASNPVIGEYSLMDRPGPPDPTQIRPLLADADNRPLAAIIERDHRQWWWLPAGAPDKPAWIATAFAEWSTVSPDTFPSQPVWATRPQWQTSAERTATADLQAFRERRELLLADMDEEERTLAQELSKVTEAANRTERRLLTGQGDPLVDEVKAALEEFGFEVTNVDADIATKGDLLEDLRVEDSEAPGWISLVEVRGYAGGAKVGDFQRIGRFVERYILAERKSPASRWYIVNQFLDRDPDARPQPPLSNSSDVQIFAESGGLVIDTRALFQELNEARTFPEKKMHIRQNLRDSTGIYVRHDEGGAKL
jgi:hypothetical protein